MKKVSILLILLTITMTIHIDELKRLNDVIIYLLGILSFWFLHN